MSWVVPVMGALSSVGSAAMQQPGMMPSQSGDLSTAVAFDNSGWTVATSGGRASASRSQEEMTEGSELTKYIIFGIAAVVAIAWMRKK